MSGCMGGQFHQGVGHYMLGYIVRGGQCSLGYIVREHYTLGYIVRGDNIRGDNIYYDTGIYQYQQINEYMYM